MIDQQPVDPDWAKNEKLLHRLNPCDIARFPCLAPLGDAVARLIPDCPCCAGFRLIGAFILGTILGYFL